MYEKSLFATTAANGQTDRHWRKHKAMKWQY